MAPPGPSVRGLAGLPPASCPPLGRSGTRDRWLSGSRGGARRTPHWVTTPDAAAGRGARLGPAWLRGRLAWKGPVLQDPFFPNPAASCNTCWNLTFRVFLWFGWVSSASFGQTTALSAEGHVNMWDGAFLSFPRTIIITSWKEKSPEIGLNQLETNQPNDP